MKITLEVSGGFTGPAGKSGVSVDVAHLPEREANKIRALVAATPDSAWGGSFFEPHPKPWDFRHTLCVEENGNAKRVVFHRNQGPASLTELADKVNEAGNKS
ncbi:MAG: protealysin inhibitor emfourin [Limisphaerales bacterium]